METSDFANIINLFHIVKKRMTDLIVVFLIVFLGIVIADFWKMDIYKASVDILITPSQQFSYENPNNLYSSTYQAEMISGVVRDYDLFVYLAKSSLIQEYLKNKYKLTNSEFNNNLAVESPRRVNAIRFVCKGDDYKKACAITNDWANVFVEFFKNIRTAEALKILKRLEDEYVSVEKMVHDQEDSINKFDKDNNHNPAGNAVSINVSVIPNTIDIKNPLSLDKQLERSRMIKVLGRLNARYDGLYQTIINAKLVLINDKSPFTIFSRPTVKPVINENKLKWVIIAFLVGIIVGLVYIFGKEEYEKIIHSN